MAIKMHNLVYNELEVIEGLINNPSTEQVKGVLDYYCGNVSYRLIGRVDRYLLGQGISNLDERVKFISQVLDKYDMMYNRDYITKQISDKQYIPLKQSDDRIKYYRSEIDLIKSLGEWRLQKFAFSILTYAKHNQIVHGHTDILNDDDTFVDLYNLSGAGDTTKENIYFLIHELVKRDLLVVPISLKSFDDMVEVNYVEQDEESEVVYELGNTDIFKLSEVFESIFGEYRSVHQRCVLEVSLVEDFHCVYGSVVETVEEHNKRYAKKKVDKTSVSRCCSFERANAGDSAFIEWDWNDREDEEYIKQVCDFVRGTMKKSMRKVKALKGKWIITRDFMGAINEETGEILVSF